MFVVICTELLLLLSCFLCRFLSHNNITVLHDQDFRGLQAVKYIDLSYSNITEVRGSPFLELNNLEELHLRNNNLEDEDVQLGTFNTSGKLIYLDLTANRLTSIPDLNGKYFPYLHQLDIGDNNISYISNSQLRNMTSLYALVLRGNPIEVMENESFMECQRVADLNLDDTRIKKLPEMRNMVQLTDLHIVHSSLEYFPDDFCFTNPRLIIIEATANNLQKLINFSGCHHLFSLALDHNEIPEIPEGVFNGLTKLDILKLHENHISYIAPGVFNDLRILKTLTLYHNNIRDLPEGIFSQLTALRKLNLGFNHIRVLKSGVFANNTLLSGLWLNDNNIQEVHTTAFSSMPFLETLNMSSNYFCSLEFPEGGFESLRVLGLEQLWCLHNVPSPHTMPRAQEVFYTYAYHCCLWEDILNSNIHDNDTVLPTTVSPDATGIITLPTEVVPILPGDPFECPSEGASPERLSAILEVAKLYNLTIKWGPDCSFTVEGPVNIGLSADDIVNLQNGQPTTVLDDNIIIGTETEGFFDGINELRNHYVPEPSIYIQKEVECYPRPNPLTPCDNLLDPWPIRVAIWAVWVLTLLGNIAVLFIMIAARQRMDVSQFFICVLAFSNTLLGIYLAFIAMVDIRTLGDRSFYQSALEWQKGSGCQTAGFLAIFSSQLSVYILVILTIERLHTVVTTTTPPFSKENRKLHVGVLLIIIGIVYACILAILPLSGMGINAYDEVAICLPFVSKTPADRNYILTILSLNMLGILIMVIAFLFGFAHLFRPSLSSRKRWEICAHMTKLSLLTITTFLCWFPIGIVGYTSIIQGPIINAEQAKYFVVFVFPVNALFSPIIYALITRSFRKNIWWIITCCPNRKNKDAPQQTFRLVQRQATSTPTSMMSSELLRGQSPRSLTGEELRVLRQSRRSNSYSVQFNPNLLNQPQCQTPPTPGSITRMGRRASLPAVFGSNIVESHSYTNSNESSTAQTTAFPFRFAPGLLSQLNNSLPNLPEENENEETDIVSENHMDTVASSPNEKLVFRKLSTVQESDETDTVADSLTVKQKVGGFNSVGYTQMDALHDDKSVEYMDDTNSTASTPMTGIQPPHVSNPTVLSTTTVPFCTSKSKLEAMPDIEESWPKCAQVRSVCGVYQTTSQERSTLVKKGCSCSSASDTYYHTCSNQGFTYHPLSPSCNNSPSPALGLPKCTSPNVKKQSTTNLEEVSNHCTDALEPDAASVLSKGALDKQGNGCLNTDGFDYTRLCDPPSPCNHASKSSRLEIVNPRFTTLSPTQGSETDV